MENKKIFGFDMGSNSIGWCVQTIGENGITSEILGLGTRIFDNSRDAKTRVPLSVERRISRSASTRRDRQIMRTKHLCNLLRRYGLLPKQSGFSLADRNPYKLRAKAVHEKIDLLGIGRAILHINKRRGFKSNRKADKKSGDSESLGMKAGISRLRQELGDRTLGEFLYERRKSSQPVRMRAESIKRKNHYEIYAERSMYEEEFRRMWETQQKFHKNLTGEMYAEIFDAIFSQRPLRVPERGWCQFEAGQRRAYKAYPISQKFRILQEVNALEIIDASNPNNRLAREQKQKLAKALLENDPAVTDKKSFASFSKIKRFLGIPKFVSFNFESENRKGFEGDSTARILACEDCFSDSWNGLSDELREKIVDLIMADNEGEFLELAAGNFGFDPQKARFILDAGSALKDGTVSLSSKAMHKIVPFLEEGELYHNACARSGYNFNANYVGELLDALPYYGKILRNSVLGGNTKFDPEKEPEKYYGKINNPTVHVALNQLRKVYNKLAEVYGKPDCVVIETARELPLGEKGLGELVSRQVKNREKNEEIAGELEKLGVANNAKNRMKYKLWEDLSADVKKRACPFCGRQIELSKLFTADFEVEHLLPFSETFDDSRANKVISCASCNRILKGKRSPYDAFANRAGFAWEEILSRASELPQNKQWRFREDAWEIFEEKYGDFIQRMLNDTRYMSKVAREYLTCVLSPKNVLAVSGGITALLRGRWGLNSILDDSKTSEEAVKNRDDHRHHAVDAFVISCVNAKLIKKISEAAKLAEEAHLENVLKNIPTPYEFVSFDSIKKLVGSIIVSHKLDRGDVKGALKKGKTIAKLHNDTAYGRINNTDSASDKITLAKRVPLSSIECKMDAVSQIANSGIREDLSAYCGELLANAPTDKSRKEMWSSFLSEYQDSKKVRRVRIHIPNRETRKLIAIADKRGRIYKYMENAESYCVDIYKPSDSDKWDFEVVNMYAAHKIGIPNWRQSDPHAKLIMRIFKRDTIAYEEGGEHKLAVVKGIATHGQISLLPLNQADASGNLPKRTPSSLQKLKARKVYVDEIGRLFDSQKMNE